MPSQRSPVSIVPDDAETEVCTSKAFNQEALPLAYIGFAWCVSVFQKKCSRVDLRLVSSGSEHITGTREWSCR